MTGTADYDIDMIRDILYVPNGINTAYLEENYVLTGYINDINTEYTQVLVEYGNTGSYDSVYEYGNQRTTMYQNGEVYSYEYDGRGSVSELVNSIGETQIKYSYGAYGETISTVIGWNNPVTNPYRYNAERIDDIAGVPAFQYLRARYLNPYTANFLTQDSYLGNLLVPLSQNRYTYAHNNPVMYTDPSGHMINSSVIFPIIFSPDKDEKVSVDTMSPEESEEYDEYVKQKTIQAKAKELAKLCIDLDYARLAQDVYDIEVGDKNDKMPRIGGWYLDDIYTNEWGLKIGIYKKYNSDGTISYAIVNTGTQNDQGWGTVKDWIDNFSQPVGNSKDMTDSIDFAEQFVKDHSNDNVVFVGHSKGGAEAIGNATATNKDAVVFNQARSYPDRYGVNTESYQGSITSYIVKGEVLNTALNTAEFISKVAQYDRHKTARKAAQKLKETLESNQEPSETVYLQDQENGNPVDKHGMETVINSMEEILRGGWANEKEN